MFARICKCENLWNIFTFKWLEILETTQMRIQNKKYSPNISVNTQMMWRKEQGSKIAKFAKFNYIYIRSLIGRSILTALLLLNCVRSKLNGKLSIVNWFVFMRILFFVFFCHSHVSKLWNYTTSAWLFQFSDFIC